MHGFGQPQRGNEQQQRQPFAGAGIDDVRIGQPVAQQVIKTDGDQRGDEDNQQTPQGERVILFRCLQRRDVLFLQTAVFLHGTS